jgi:hypothetical protein
LLVLLVLLLVLLLLLLLLLLQYGVSTVAMIYVTVAAIASQLHDARERCTKSFPATMITYSHCEVGFLYALV